MPLGLRLHLAPILQGLKKYQCKTTRGWRCYSTFEQNENYVNWEAHMNPRVKTQKPDHCWIIGAIDCLESVYKLYTGETLVMSPQHILDKAQKERDQSTLEEYEKGQRSEGGSVRDAYNFISRNGVALESDWPYSEAPTKAPIKEDGRRIFIGGYQSVTGKGEIMRQLKHHPLVGCVAVHPLLNYYKSGDVMKSSQLQFFKGTKWNNNKIPKCRSRTCPNHDKDVDDFCSKCGYGVGWHTVVIVGYDTSAIGEHRWIIRNTMGKNWGNNGIGYLKMTESRKEMTTFDINEAFKNNQPLGLLNIELFAAYSLPHHSWKKKGRNGTITENTCIKEKPL